MIRTVVNKFMCWQHATNDIWVSWSWQVGPGMGSTPCLTDRVGDRDIVRQFLLPREPGVEASARKKITDNSLGGLDIQLIQARK